MVLDAAPMAPKGIEEQTRKLFEVCRLRDVPIVTFVNKLDRDGPGPFDVLHEIEQSLALDVTPASWPIGTGRNFLATYDLLAMSRLYWSNLPDAKRPRGGTSTLCSSLTTEDLPITE
jgi:peptide chain release factor 3